MVKWNDLQEFKDADACENFLELYCHVVTEQQLVKLTD
jgi:hypothetical protein